MSQPERAPLIRGHIVKAIILLILSTQLKPLLQEYHIYGQYLCYFVAGCEIVTVLRTLPRVMMHRLKRRRAFQASSNYGDASWLSALQIKARGLYRTTNMLFMGLCCETGKPLFANLQPHGFLYAATGSGKTRDFFIPTLLHYAGSLITIDMKATQAVITAKARMEQFGHRIITLNPSQLESDILGLSERYNPLQIIINAWRRGCIQDIVTLTKEFVAQIYPESKHQSHSISPNRYFHNGTQGILMFVFMYLITLSKERPATLNAAFMMLCDQEAVIDALYTAQSSDVLKGDLALMATKLLDIAEAENKEHWNTFLEGASQQLTAYSNSSWLADVTSASDFEITDLKKERITLYIIIDPARREAFYPWAALMGWCYQKEMLLDRSATVVPFLMDEASNTPIHNVMSSLTEIREYGGRFFFSFQSMAAMEKAYGKEDVQIMKDQCHLQIFLNVNEHKLSEELSAMLGNTTMVTENNQIGYYKNDLTQLSVSEAAKPLLSPIEIRACEHTIIAYEGQFLRSWSIGYHQATPWCHLAETNPFYKKRYKGKIQLRLRYSKNV